MDFITLFLTAVGLSMDAFAVSVCKGLATPQYKAKYSLICGAWFGVFQAVMPLIGWLLGVNFKNMITSFDHWIAFILLAVIGFNMVKEGLSKDDETTDPSFSAKSMLMLAIATSIDALAVGITYAFLDVNIGAAVLFIGVCTFVISAVGVKIGSVFGTKYKSGAELAGGIILILIGVKTLIEHLFFFD
ncbi:MAG: manganese efflux pump MntP family protein [Oscillospiraceae bacterium]|nr:manganese efflux pump MntP family protein [Oscillospiraceae bacterium]